MAKGTFYRDEDINFGPFKVSNIVKTGYSAEDVAEVLFHHDKRTAARCLLNIAPALLVESSGMKSIKEDDKRSLALYWIGEGYSVERIDWELVWRELVVKAAYLVVDILNGMAPAAPEAALVPQQSKEDADAGLRKLLAAQHEEDDEDGDADYEE